jgi:hypothetical protein
MWEFSQGNWSGILVVLVVLACPLTHALGRRHGRREHPGE